MDTGERGAQCGCRKKRVWLPLLPPRSSSSQCRDEILHPSFEIWTSFYLLCGRSGRRSFSRRIASAQQQSLSIPPRSSHPEMGHFGKYIQQFSRKAFHVHKVQYMQQFLPIAILCTQQHLRRPHLRNAKTLFISPSGPAGHHSRSASAVLQRGPILRQISFHALFLLLPHLII